MSMTTEPRPVVRSLADVHEVIRAYDALHPPENSYRRRLREETETKAKEEKERRARQECAAPGRTKNNAALGTQWRDWFVRSFDALFEGGFAQMMGSVVAHERKGMRAHVAKEIAPLAACA
jgi:hypothetical protein